MRAAFLLVGLCLVASLNMGCATIVTGKYETVTVTSDPPGVKVRAQTGEYIETPGQFDLLRNKDHVLVATYPGAEAQQRQIKHGLQGWFFGNILLGGIIGGVVDLASGASDHLTPKKVHFDFTGAGQVAAERKAEYLQSNPDVKDEVQVAIENEVGVKGMTKDQLIAALGVPDEIVKDGEYDKFTYASREPPCYYFKAGVLEKAE